MRLFSRLNPFARLAAMLLVVLCAALGSAQAQAGDLPAASDGQHFWLIEQAPAPENDKQAGPRLVLYHLPADTDRYLATKLDPIDGQLMPRGFAAGDDRLLLATSDRQMITIRPVWSELMRQWVYQKRSLTSLPRGCTLVSLAVGERGPWALVQVQSRELLDQLDTPQSKPNTPADQQMLNKALGLPEDLRWDEPSQDEQGDTPQDEASEGGEEAGGTPEGGAESEPAADIAPEPEPQVEPPVKPALPAYRLLKLERSKWVSSPLPAGFTVPGKVEMILRPGDDRPTLLIDGNHRRGSTLIRYNPIVPAKTNQEQGQGDEADASRPQAPAWSRLATGMYLPSGRRWSVEIVNGQIVVALERFQPHEAVTIDTYLLRGDDAYAIGASSISVGDNARWALMPKQNDIGLLASPAPPLPPEVDPSDRLPTLALLVGLSMDGQSIFQNEQGQSLMMPIAQKKPTILDGNADLFIQILAFITAMFMMVMFYRRAPQPDQLDLPDHLVLASFGRRAFAGLIDLSPGFFLAMLIYDLSVGQILFEAWPGNGVEKAFAAMRPGFIVIGVTLFHTTISEFILARSLGKIMMGMYVADLNGKPAPPAPCFGRALSRAFELFAPLMILVAVISPARQRLGDILAKTTVVMRKPEPFQFDEDDE